MMDTLPLIGAPFVASTFDDRVLWTTLVLLLATGCAWDISARRIPNALAVVMAVLGLGLAALSSAPGDALLRALGGVATGLAIWFPFFAMRSIGAGDVKFFAAACAWLGPMGAVQASFVAIAIGGVFAVVYMFAVFGPVAVPMLHPRAMIASIREGHSRPLPNDRRSLPYGVALSLGVAVTALLPTLVR